MKVDEEDDEGVSVKVLRRGNGNGIKYEEEEQDDEHVDFMDEDYSSI